MNNTLFFELLQVSLGTRKDLSKKPSVDEWFLMYDEAKRHCVLGVCLEALNREGGRWADERGLPDEMKLRWVGRVEKITDENRHLDRQCQQLCDKLTRSGYWNCILKGQSLARLYPHPQWRQSGDIDVWVAGNRRKLVEMTRRVTGRREEVTYHHTDFNVFPDTPVELHFTPSWMFNPFLNRRMQRWFKEHQQAEQVGGFPVPTREFNAVFVLLHIFRHVFDEGVGLRQIIDYFYVLKDFAKLYDYNDMKDMAIFEDIAHLGLGCFARGLMWVMHEALGMPREMMIIEPDEKRGRWLLSEIMQGGNFGHYDKRNEGIYHDSARMTRLRWRFAISMPRLHYFPLEALWEMPWRIWHFLWRWKNGYL